MEVVLLCKLRSMYRRLFGGLRQGAVNQEPHGAETFQETVLMRLGSSSHDVPMPCFLIIKHLLLESDSTTAVSWVILNHGNCGRCLWKLMAS
ncbi:hypothetical protein V6N11_068672 [Hibiscus sabdariffa]|uniref:Uncharacterized protein n=1 Tax=Hibiscus sabdariffa TaxID=183260 RepID=A0ABR2PAE6_9ROSI